jgi:hypothetical protein
MQLCRIISKEVKEYGKGNGIKLTYELDAKVHAVVIFDKDPFLPVVSEFVAGTIVQFKFGKTEKGFTSLIEIGEIIPPVSESESIPTMAEIKSLVDDVNKQPKSNSYDSNQDKQRSSIERQTSLKAAVELVVGCGVKYKTKEEAYLAVLSCAEGFYDYITQRISICEESTKEQ